MIRHARIIANECRVNGKLVGHAWNAGKVWLWTAGSAELGIAESRKREAKSKQSALHSLRQYVQNQLKLAAKQPHGIEEGQQVAWAQPTRNGHNAYSGEVVKVDGDTLRVRVRRFNRDGQPLTDRFFNLGANKVAQVV